MTQTPWGGRYSYRASTTSTMDDAQILEASGEPDGSLAWAGFQTAGRGRHAGRRWSAQPGASLLFTVYWAPTRFQDPGFAASLTVGLGVCLWLESLGLSSDFPVSLKWPNDVYLADRKVAGILVRRRIDGPGTVHAGIGVNLLPPEVQGEFRTPPGSIFEAGVECTPAQALEGLLPFLAQALDHPDPQTACAQRLWKAGQTLSLVLPDGSRRTGTVKGLDGTGSLLLEGEAGVEVIHSGE